MTDGWFCIDAGGRELLRYADAAGGGERGVEAGPFDRYVDYYVVRLWEDVLNVLPAVLEPVPGDLVALVLREPVEGGWSSEGPPGAESDAVETAAYWCRGHALDLGYLRDPPRVRFWRTLADGVDAVTVDWAYYDGADVEFARTGAGRVTVSTVEFLAAVTEFDRALLAAMELRVSELEASGPPPGVEVDLRHLRHEQVTRATWLQAARDRGCSTDWEEVRIGAQVLLRNSP